MKLGKISLWPDVCNHHEKIDFNNPVVRFFLMTQVVACCHG